jgi:dTMP kinase
MKHYIVFEGIDGCGKTTLAKALCKALSGTAFAHLSVEYFAFPSVHNPVGALVREVLADVSCVRPTTMLWLFLAEAVDRDGAIRLCIDKGGVAIVDRHVSVSSRIYQRKHYDTVALSMALQAAQLTRPDRVWILDVPPQLARSRALERGSNRYDAASVEVYEKRRDAYLEYAESNPAAQVLDGRLPTEELLTHVLDDLRV